MTIQTFSPLQGDGNYYLNQDEFDSRLMWTDTGTTINYVMCRLEGSEWKLIANGRLNGYDDGVSEYQYKFDFNNYIKINHEKDLIFNTESSNFFSNFDYQSSCSLSLVLSTSNIITDNAVKITTKSNGEMVLSNSYVPSGLTANVAVLDYVFYDSINGNVQQPSSQYFYTDSYIPFTVGKGQDMYITTYNNNGIINEHHGISDRNSKIFLFYIPSDCIRIEVAGINGNNNTYTFYPIQSQCKTQLFYYSIYGNLDMMYIEGNTHEVNNVTKDYINISNQKLPININIQKQLKCNTGFRLDQSQVYSLIKTPYVFIVTKGQTPTMKRYLLDTTTFEGFVGSRYSEKNIELILTEEKVHKRKTNIDLTFWD